MLGAVANATIGNVDLDSIIAKLGVPIFEGTFIPQQTESALRGPLVST